MKLLKFLSLIIVASGLSTSAMASESKIICGHEKVSGNGPNILFDNDEALRNINSKIKMAEAEDFTRVSAPMSMNSAGSSQAFCVTVTKN